MMRLDLATDDFIGARSQQQDAAAAQSIGRNGGAMLVLADGLGGHTGGAEASRIVIETFGAAADAGTFDTETGRRPGLRSTLEKANERIADGVEPAHGQRGMASTAVAVILADGLVNWISVGDSHLYVWRRGRLAKLNEDHSQAGLMVRSGQYKPDDPEVAAAKSVLVSALTGRKLEIVDHPAQAFAVQKGDVVLLASDGLNTLSEAEIEAAVTSAQAQGAGHVSTLLLDKVRERRADRQDNTAVVVACVVDLRETAKEAQTQIAADPQRVTTPAALAEATSRLEAGAVAASNANAAKPLATAAHATVSGATLEAEPIAAELVKTEVAPEVSDARAPKADLANATPSKSSQAKTEVSKAEVSKAQVSNAEVSKARATPTGPPQSVSKPAMASAAATGVIGATRAAASTTTAADTKPTNVPIAAGAPLSEPAVAPSVAPSGPPPGLIAKLLLGLAIATAVAGTYLFWKPAQAPAPSVPTEKRSGSVKPEPALVEPPAPAVPPTQTPTQSLANPPPALAPTNTATPALVPPQPQSAQPQSPSPDAAKPAGGVPTRTPGAAETSLPATGGAAAPAPQPPLIEPPTQVGPRGSLPPPAAPVRSLVPSQR